MSYTDAATGAKQIQLLGLSGLYVQMLTENMPDSRGLGSVYGLDHASLDGINTGFQKASAAMVMSRLRGRSICNTKNLKPGEALC